MNKQMALTISALFLSSVSAQEETSIQPLTQTGDAAVTPLPTTDFSGVIEKNPVEAIFVANTAQPSTVAATGVITHPTSTPLTLHPSSTQPTDSNSGTTNSAPLSAPQLQQLHQLIKATVEETLKNNPEMIINAIQTFSDKQQQDQQKKVDSLVAENKTNLIDPSSSSIIGDQNAEKKLVVFVDPNCPHCREFEKILIALPKKQPKVGVYLRHWAILGDDSSQVIKGILAAHKQGKFTDISQKISETEGGLNGDSFMKIASDPALHINIEQLKKDMESEAVIKTIEANRELAEKIGLQWTPATVLITPTSTKMISPTDEESLIEALKDTDDSSVSTERTSAAKTAHS